MKSFLLPIVSAIAMASGVAIAQPANPTTGAGPAGPGRMYGWSLMTAQERAEHQQKLQAFEHYDECTAYVAEHHKLMQVRATEKGVALPAAPMRDMCARLKPNKANGGS